MAHAAYVEDVADYEGWEDLTPGVLRPAHEAGGFNVFDYQVDATSDLSPFAAAPPIVPPFQTSPGATELVPYVYDGDPYQDFDADMMADDEPLVQYGSGPVQAGPSRYATPAARKEHKRARKVDKKDKKDKDKKDRKRKRPPHVDVRDLDMPDAPVLHSGPTGGVNRLMTRSQVFPPSPDYSGSGGETNENPVTPLKKSKHTRHHKPSPPDRGMFRSITSMLASRSPKQAVKPKKRRHTPMTRAAPTRKRQPPAVKRLDGGKEVKMLEYGRADDGPSRDGPGTMVVFNPRVDLFMSLVHKGPESERGCSLHKVLKRYHRERKHAGRAGSSKSLEEKDLFRSLRLRRNEQGEVVLFCVPDPEY